MDPQMVKEFQCPGCMNGSDPADCEAVRPDDFGEGCGAHFAATYLGLPGPATKVALGMPKGFDKVGVIPTTKDAGTSTNVRLWTGLPKDLWNRLNVPVWAMEYEGHLIVRTFLPRVGRHYVDVVRGASLSDAPGAIDVSDFLDQID